LGVIPNSTPHPLPPPERGLPRHSNAKSCMDVNAESQLSELDARPPAGVRAPSRAVRVDGDPAVPAHQPPDEQVRIYGVPAPAHVEVQHRAEVGLEGGPDPRRDSPRSQRSHRRICDALPSGRRRLEDWAEPLHPPPHRGVAPADGPQGPGGPPQREARGIGITAWAMTGRGVLLLIWIGLVLIAGRAEGSPRI